MPTASFFAFILAGLVLGLWLWAGNPGSPCTVAACSARFRDGPPICPCSSTRQSIVLVSRWLSVQLRSRAPQRIGRINPRLIGQHEYAIAAALWSAWGDDDGIPLVSR